MRFVLIHGAMHGAWCWERLIPELAALGHQAVAIDLPGAGQRYTEKATLGAYRHAVADVIEDGDVLVGHSMGGWAMTVGADEVPTKVARVIYLAAGVPEEGRSIMDTFGDARGPEGPADISPDGPISVVETEHNGQALNIGDFESVVEMFYHDCTPADQRWAFERLLPQPLAPAVEPIHVPNFWQSSIPRNMLFGLADRGHPQALITQGMSQLGLTIAVGINTSHSPFISRPNETARLLDLCVQRAFDVSSVEKQPK